MLYLPSPFKQCAHCLTPLLPTTQYFHVSLRQKDRLRNICKQCAVTYNRTHARDKRSQSAQSAIIYDPFPFKYCCRGNRCIHPNGPYLPRSTQYFYYSADSVDRLGKYCKICKREEQHKDAARKATRNHRYESSHREQIKRRHQIYAKTHPEIQRTKKRKWRRLNPDKSREEFRRWSKKYPEKIRARRHKREALKRNLPSGFSTDDWSRSLQFFHSVCAYCGNPPSMFDQYNILQEDHFVPLSKGGPYTTDNILPACQTCNLSKHNFDPCDWLVSRFGTRKAKQILKRIQEYFDWVKEQNGHHD